MTVAVNVLCSERDEHTHREEGCAAYRVHGGFPRVVHDELHSGCGDRVLAIEAELEEERLVLMMMLSIETLATG